MEEPEDQYTPMPFCTDDNAPDQVYTYHYVCPALLRCDELIKSLDSSITMLLQFCDAVLQLNTNQCCAYKHYCNGAKKYADETITVLMHHGVKFIIKYELSRSSCDVTYVTCTHRDIIIYDKCAAHCC
jgi:hypothetical protein